SDSRRRWLRRSTERRARSPAVSRFLLYALRSSECFFLASLEFSRALGMEGFDAFTEVFRLPQPAVAMTFELDGDRQCRILGVVVQLLRCALRDRREGEELVDQRVGCRFELLVGDAFGGDAPVERLLSGNALRAHHNILGARDADDLLQPRRAAGTGNLPELLLRQRVLAGLRDNAEVAGEGDLEADAEAVAAIGDDHRFRAASRRGDVPGELGDMLGRGFHEAFDVAAAREVLADRAQHDDAHAGVLVERLENQAQLVALRHLDHIERGAVEDDVRALLALVELHGKAVERRKAGIGETHDGHAAVPCEWDWSSPTNSPAVSFLRNSLPTGERGIS